MSGEPAGSKNVRQLIVGYFRDFNVLRETRAEYWGVQAVSVLDNTFYFAMLTIASVFLSHDLQLSDERAGYAITAFTTATTIFLFFSGAFTDWLGIRRSLYGSLVGMLLLRAGVVIVGLTPSLPHRGALAGALLFLMAPFMASMQTVYQASCARFTTQRSRSAGFNVWYLFMNVGAALGGVTVDVVRKSLHLANVHIFTMGFATALLSLAATALLIRRETQLLGADEANDPKAEAKFERKRPWQTARELVRETAFWRLSALITLILGVRAVYAYNYLLMPKYWLRTIGPDAAIGALNTINPIGIVIGLILFIPIANKFNIFNMLVYGAMISALSLAPMAAPWQWYGMGIARAHYAMAIACMALLTLGEVIWSPKLYEFTAAMAPKGQEGTYLGVSMIPWFFAKMLVSVLSGHMLAHWSPEYATVAGARVPLQAALEKNLLDYWHTPSAMWLILGAVALAGCLAAALLRGWLTAGAHWKIEHPAA